MSSGRRASEEEVRAVETEAARDEALQDARQRDDGLTADEGIVMDALVQAVEAFARLERQHPQEINDFIDGIHRCQDLLAVRIARRHYPIGWPNKGTLG